MFFSNWSSIVLDPVLYLEWQSPISFRFALKLTWKASSAPNSASVFSLLFLCNGNQWGRNWEFTFKLIFFSNLLDCFSMLIKFLWESLIIIWSIFYLIVSNPIICMPLKKKKEKKTPLFFTSFYKMVSRGGMSIILHGWHYHSGGLPESHWTQLFVRV